MLFKEVNKREDIDIAIFLGQFCLKGKGAMRLTLYEASTCETRPDHDIGNSGLLRGSHIKMSRMLVGKFECNA